MDEFMRLYEEYKGSRPMYLIIKHIGSGIPRWRIHIFEKGTAPAGGDMELIFAEDPVKEICIHRAIEQIKRRMRLFAQ